MCLDIINETKPIEVGTGYKVVRVVDDGLSSLCLGFEITESVWLEAVRDEWKWSPTLQNTGFHIYKTRQAARNTLKHVRTTRHWQSFGPFKIVKVIYKDAIVEGLGDGCFDIKCGDKSFAKVVVAKQMKVIG